MPLFTLMMRLMFLTAAALLAGCNTLPRDPEGTQERIEESRQFSVASTDAVSLRSDQHVAGLIAEIEKQTGAKARWASTSGEPSLKRLADGEIDLVIGHFRRDSPWKTEIAFGPPLVVGDTGHDPIELKAAMRNGENRWIMTVERASRAVSAEARRQ